MPKLNSPSATRKLSVNLHGETLAELQRLAARRGVTLSDIVRESVATYKLIADELALGSEVVLERDGTRTRVKFVFG
jgi:hypothetical protein